MVESIQLSENYIKQLHGMLLRYTEKMKGIEGNTRNWKTQLLPLTILERNRNRIQNSLPF